MAIIYTYPTTTTLENSDLFVISKMQQEGKPTRSISAANLANFIAPLITGSGTVTSVGLSIDNPTALSVAPASTPVTTTGTLGLEWNGDSSQVVLGDGTLGSFDDVVSEAVYILIPYFQTATPGGSDTYTQPNNIVDFDWSGGSGTYEYILPSATAIPYRKIRFVNNSTITASDKIHITAPGTETIDGGAFYEINKPYNGCAVWSDGVQWIVIQAKA